ncbi:MAG: HAMP domain-containing protein [Myxococcales bacterium]|nr:HAMP domain-containing protein [Myxococcales bacterium]
MSLRRKMTYGIALAGVIVAVAFVAGLEIAAHQRDAIGSLKKATTELGSDVLELIDGTAAMKLDVVQVQQFLTDISATRGQDGLDDGAEKAAGFAAKFAEDARRARAAAAKLAYQDIVTAVDDAVVAFGPYYETGQKMAARYVADGPSGGNTLMGSFDATSAAIADRLDVVLDATSRHAKELAARAKAHGDDAESGAAHALTNLQLLGGVVLLLLALGGYFLLRGVTRPLDQLAADMAAVGGGDLDRVIAGAGRKDELGRMAGALEGFRASQRAMRALEAETAAREDAAAKARKAELAAMADNLERSIASALGAIKSSAAEMRAEAKALAGNAAAASERADGVSSASARAADNVGGVAAASQQMAAAISEITEQVNRARQISGTAVGEVQDTDHAMVTLAESVRRIGDIVNVIAGIAKQTNILALNASVEAARAGHAGQGFGIVAKEVGSLAAEVGTSANEIKRQVEGIQGAVADVTGSVGRVAGTIRRIDDISTAIAAGVEQQRSATMTIAQNVQNAAAGTQEVSSHIGVVGNAANETGHAAERLLEVATMVADESGRLDREVRAFVARVRAA